MRIIISALAAIVHLLFWIPVALLATPFAVFALLPQRRQLAFVPVRARNPRR